MIKNVIHQQKIRMSFINKKYKDSVFTDLFGSDRDGKKNFLELYNGLSGSDYKLEEVTVERKVIEQELRLSDAFYKKDGSSLELVVKVRNCTNSQMLPIAKDSAILKQYCQFIEIVERTFNKKFPK